MHDTIDVTGLPEPVVNDLRQLVNTLRGRLGAKNGATPQRDETPEQWAGRLAAWAAGHPKRAVEIDDSRESIYGGRGE
jgi:hypothetical protein